MKKKWILFYDSGIGGLTTLCETIKLANGLNLLYFADDKNCPYGNKSKNEIKKLVKYNLEYVFEKYDIELVVFACNTITACLIDELRLSYKVPFVGIEPAVLPALKKSKTKEILVVATNATIRQSKYLSLVKRGEGKVYSLGFETLAKDIEECFINGARSDFKAYINEINNAIHDFCCFNIDKIVLGCTHYSFVKKIFSKELQKECVDGNYGVAKRVKMLISNDLSFKKRCEDKLNHIEIMLTSNEKNKMTRYYRLVKDLKMRES